MNPQAISTKVMMDSKLNTEIDQLYGPGKQTGFNFPPIAHWHRYINQCRSLKTMQTCIDKENNIAQHMVAINKIVSRVGQNYTGEFSAS